MAVILFADTQTEKQQWVTALNRTVFSGEENMSAAFLETKTDDDTEGMCLLVLVLVHGCMVVKVSECVSMKTGHGP